MSSIDRQNSLSVAENWKRIYQSFRNSEFKSYDFDTLRRIMISYLKENYPEDFNDYIDSSEYIALVDLLAFLGQNLAFRIDLNARENFLDLAERKESILRLARLLSYNPKRNQCANGFLKIVGVSTTEDIIASDGFNLQGQTVIWNDPSNANWNEHYTRVLNAALPEGNKIGRPLKTNDIGSLYTRLYRFNATNTSVPIYPFSKNVKGSTVDFEIVPCDFSSGSIIEEAPLPGNSLSFMYRDDKQGPGGTNTGYFCYFKQGSLNSGNFTISTPATNQVVAINTSNINHSDVWLYSLDADNKEDTLWNKVDAIEGNNVIYNNKGNERKLYSVLTRMNDRVSLIFSDGVFGEIPQGNFKSYYRVSRNQNISINPSSLRGITVTIPYRSAKGSDEEITLTLSLKYTVNNASVSESDLSIKQNAPSTFYTQNRLISAEDYQVGVNSVHQDIVKSKTVNRSASGISRYLDLIDPTGKYSNTTLFSDDGVIYKKYDDVIDFFEFTSLTDVEGAIYNVIEPIFSDAGLLNYYMGRFPRPTVKDFNIFWNSISSSVDSNTGIFVDQNKQPVRLGSYVSSNLKYVKANTLVKFEAPSGKVFHNNVVVDADQTLINAKSYKWAKVVRVLGDGTDENGGVILNTLIPEGAHITDIITPLPSRLTDESVHYIVNTIMSHQSFGLRYSQPEGEWRIINQNNLDIVSNFSMIKSGDTTNEQLDSSWLILFEFQGGRYRIRYRTLSYIFESDYKIQFYTDTSSSKNNDSITILDVNKKPDSHYSLSDNIHWSVKSEYKDLSGYASNKKVVLELHDSDNDGTVDNPDVFNDIVDEAHDRENKLIFLQAITVYGKVNDYTYLDDLDVVVFDKKLSLRNLASYDDGQLFYFIDENVFERFDRKTFSLKTETKYLAYFGRAGLKFKYDHFSDQNARIDPGLSNIMDSYILTRDYNDAFRKWLSTQSIDNKPLPPSSDSLYTSFGGSLNKIKSINDEIIYHPAKYKILFGRRAEKHLRAVFKVVKNDAWSVNDNQLKLDITNAIRRYFSLENWDFGETFYFSEMAAYVIKELSPNIQSFLIVPVQDNLSFGALHEIHSKPDEIFIGDVTVEDIEIISEITDEVLRSSGIIRGSALDLTNRIVSG